MARKVDEFGLLAHLDTLLAELQDSVPRAMKEFDLDGIHDARVATRRLKAAMRLLAPVLSDDRRRAFENVLKKVRRRLGPLRDMDVMIGHLSKLEAHSAHGVGAGWLRGQLEHRRDLARLESHNGPRSADVLAKLGCWWHVREQVIEADEAIDSLLAQSLHLQLDSFAERAQGIVTRIEETNPATQQQDPHELRIAGKLFRYSLEIAQSQGHQLPAAVFRHFKQLQQCLGNWHDDVVLMQCAMRISLEEMLAYHDLQMQERVLDLNRFFLRRANRELSNFVRLWRKRGPEVTRTVRAKFPITTSEPLIESKTDPDPAGSDDTPVPAELPPSVASTA
jgi:CHAD domain-containing protein